MHCVTTRRTTSKESKGILGCATAKAYKPLVNSVCEPGLKSLFWVPSCQALGLYFAGLFKKPLFVRTRFHLVIFMSIIFILFDTIYSMTIAVSRPCWLLEFYPNTWYPRSKEACMAEQLAPQTHLFFTLLSPSTSQWLSVVQRGFMKGTRNPLRFPCLPLDDLDVMIFFIRF